MRQWQKDSAPSPTMVELADMIKANMPGQTIIYYGDRILIHFIKDRSENATATRAEDWEQPNKDKWKLSVIVQRTEIG